MRRAEAIRLILTKAAVSLLIVSTGEADPAPVAPAEDSELRKVEVFELDATTFVASALVRGPVDDRSHEQAKSVLRNLVATREKKP